MDPKPTLSIDQLRQAYKRYMEGTPVRKLAQEYGVSHNLFYRHWAKHGWPRKEGGPKTTEEQRQEICRLYREGWSLNDLSGKFGTTPQSIRCVLKTRGVKLRRQGKQLIHDPAEMRDWALKYATSMKEVAKRFNVSVHTVERYIEAHELPKIERRIQASTWATIGQIATTDKTLEEIAEHIGLTHRAVKRVHHKCIRYGLVPNGDRGAQYELGYEPRDRA